MQKILSAVLVFLLIFLGFELYTKTYDPCGKPILYTIGSIDPKFGLTAPQVISYSQEASDIINNAYGKDLFSYSKDRGVLTINFTFDERSKLNSEINQQLGNIDKQNSTLQQKIKSYEAAVSLFQKKVADFNQRVQGYNSQGGAPPAVYEELKKEQQALQAEANDLNRRANELNIDSQKYNLQVGELNKDVSEFNQALGQKPEEGIYDGNTNTITVYFVNNKPELVHTIAHEFGHALGMDHVNGEKALMSPMSSKYTEFTKEDKGELEKACKAIPAYEYWREALRSKLTE